jgi:hypothetical protein
VLAVAYFTEKESGFGENDKNVFELYKYIPALNSEEGSKFMNEELLGSREEGRRYSWNVSEFNMIKRAAIILQKSLNDLKVFDILELIGSKKQVKESYKDKYISELDKKEKENIIGIYQSRLANKYVSEALGESVKDHSKGLEEILCEKEAA